MKAHALFCLGMLSAVPLAAQDVSKLRDMSLADVLQIDISTGTSKLLHQAPGVAYVVTADDIARLGARNMQEVLESIPGINVYLYQSIVNSPLVDLRGTVGERGGYVLFLRDGRPLYLIGNNTPPEIFRLPVHAIERIEVIRGPVSAVYGTNGLAGAINIITRKQPAEVGVRGGNGDDAAAWVAYGGLIESVEWAATASRSRHVDDVVTRDRLRSVAPGVPAIYTQHFEQQYTDFDLKLRAGPLSVNLWALNYAKAETGNPANPIGRTDVKTEQRHANVGYVDDITPTTEFKADLFYAYFRGRRTAVVMMNVPTNGDNGEERVVADLAFTESRFQNHRLRFNVGTFSERSANYSVQTPPPPPPGAPAPPPPPAAPGKRQIRYASLQDEFRIAADWELTAGARFDRYADLGNISSSRLGLVWNMTPQITAKLLQSDGFRAPAPAVTNSTSTKPETLRNTELVFDYRPSERWRAALNIYHYRARDLAVSGAPGAVPVARDGDGGEIELGWLATRDLKFESSYSYLSAKDIASGVRVPYTPRSSAKVAASWRIGDSWTWHLRWEGYWDRLRAPGDPRPALDDFQIVNTTLRYDASRSISLLLAAHNLFDKRSYVPVLSPSNSNDYQLLGRNLSLQMEVRF